MKSILRIAALASIFTLLGFCSIGCSPSATPPSQALAPGYLNPADEQMGGALAGADNFFHSVQCLTQGLKWQLATKTCASDPSVTSPMVLTATEKTVLNDLGISLNLANPLYLTYHANPTAANQTAAQSAINDAQAKNLTAQANIPGVK